MALVVDIDNAEYWHFFKISVKINIKCFLTLIKGVEDLKYVENDY